MEEKEEEEVRAAQFRLPVARVSINTRSPLVSLRVLSLLLLSFTSPIRYSILLSSRHFSRASPIGDSRRNYTLDRPVLNEILF